jgi:hypothetical protein
VVAVVHQAVVVLLVVLELLLFLIQTPTQTLQPLVLALLTLAQ